MSISLLHSPLNISETIEIKASFQRTTGRKWPMTNQMVTWPSCIVQLDDMQSWAVITRLLTYKDKNFLAVYLQILNWLQSVTALVLSRLDYPNATLIRIPASLCRHFQSVLNAAARSVAGHRRSDHITETLTSLHWLCASERIQFAMLVFRSLHGLAPTTLSL